MSEKDPVLKEMLRILKEEFSPLKAFLFGSRCNSTNRKDSDYDLVLVVSDESAYRRIDMQLKALELTQPLGVKADVFIYPQSEYDDWKNEFSSIPEVATNLGIELDV